LPKEWDTGQFKGICTRGAFELDMKWNEGRIISIEVLSKKGQICRINPKANVKVTSGGK